MPVVGDDDGGGSDDQSRSVMCHTVISGHWSQIIDHQRCRRTQGVDAGTPSPRELHTRCREENRNSPRVRVAANNPIEVYQHILRAGTTSRGLNSVS